jgi:hypothetical protein
MIFFLFKKYNIFGVEGNLIFSDGLLVIKKLLRIIFLF